MASGQAMRHPSVPHAPQCGREGTLLHDRDRMDGIGFGEMKNGHPHPLC